MKCFSFLFVFHYAKVIPLDYVLTISRQVLPKIFLVPRVFKVETLYNYLVSFYYCSLKKKS